MNEELKKLNSLLQTWRQSDMNNQIQNDQMISNFVSQFSSKKKKLLPIQFQDQQKPIFDKQEKLKLQMLTEQTKNIQAHFKKMFFDSPIQQNKNQNMKFVVQDIQHLFVSAEIILNTFFNSQFQILLMQEAQNDGLIDIQLQNGENQSSQKISDNQDLFQYLVNLRIAAAILANLFWNQLRILINQRIVYEQDFNYEEYRQRGMSDKRLIKDFLFMPSLKGSKNLVAEYFKFQQKSEQNQFVQNNEFLLNTSDKIKENFGVISIHLENLKIVDNDLDIEPLLIVYFHKMSSQKVVKHGLSGVSVQFFKDLKIKYRNINNLSTLIVFVIKFFESQKILMLSSNHSFFEKNQQSIFKENTDLLINQSFIQFMFMSKCDQLAEEHEKFMFKLINRKNFGDDEIVLKFKQEIRTFNHFNCVLAHIQFDNCKYYAQKALKQISRITKKLCEISENKIQKAIDDKWNNNSRSMMYLQQMQVANKQDFRNKSFRGRNQYQDNHKKGFQNTFRGNSNKF